jgi:addiction module RelE/StbE family toxin
MRELVWTKAFSRSLKRVIKRDPAVRQDIQIVLKLLQQDPFLPQLASHKLKGKLSGSWACTVAYDLRILFDFVQSEANAEDDILLLAMGSHDEVY